MASRLALHITQHLTQAWTRRGLLACLLWPLSLLFGLLAAGRRTLYRLGVLRIHRVAVPVIVVGNVFVGGTGKTPFVLWLIAQLRMAGFSPGVIARGYGASAMAPRQVMASSLAAEVGDEALLIVQRTGVPMMVGRDRPAVARALLDQYPELDVIISDDGLQHTALARDIEIILTDARGAGNGWLLPAGPLREPLSRRRDFSVFNSLGTDVPVGAGNFAMTLVGDTAERLNDPSQRLPLASLNGQRLLAAAGIGNPARFFTLLKNAGLQFDELPLTDHNAFEDHPCATISADKILITEKDAVKCRQNRLLENDPRLWVVPVDARIEPALAQQIVEKLRGYPTA